MALIKCYECGKEISDRAQYCIHCNAPIKVNKKNEELYPKDMVLIFLTVIAFIIIGIIIAAVFIK